MRRWFRNRSEKRLDQELRYHFDEQVAEYIAAGLSPEDARRKARLEFGHLDEVKGECRDVRNFAWLDDLRRDMRFALRLFARSPGFTAVCLITLALGIGANAAVFSLVNELVLTPPPFPQPDSLVVLKQDSAHLRDDLQKLFAASLFPFYGERDAFGSIADVACIQLSGSELHESDDPETITSALATDNFLSVLGTPPHLGRWFSAEEVRSQAPVVVISYELWNRRFAAAADIIGRTIRLGDRSGKATAHQVIGVLPAEMEGKLPMRYRTLSFELFRPMNLAMLDRSDPTLTFARLASGATAAQAADEIIARQQTLFPDSNHNNGGRRIVVDTFADFSISGFRTGLWVLISAVGCVLLIACANLAGLLLTRSAERGHEMAIRRGLGAGRRTIVSQTLVETGILSAGGGVLAVFTAWAAIHGLQQVSFYPLPDISRITLDWRVIACCFVLSAGMTLVIAALPAWTASRAGALGILRQTAQTLRTGDRRTRDALIVVQVALSLVLLVGAGLLVHSMGRLLAIEPGFDAKGVISLSVDSRGPLEGIPEFWRQVLARVGSTPGVDSAAAVSYSPAQPTQALEDIRIVGEPPLPPDVKQFVDSRQVDRSFFDLFEIPLLEGSLFAAPDFSSQNREIVVNRSFAAEHWPNESAVGKGVVLLDRRPPVTATVIGVVGDVRNHALKSEPVATIYLNEGVRLREALFRSNAPVETIDAVKSAIRELDPSQTFQFVWNIEDRIYEQNAELRFYMYLLSAFAGLALLLAVVGLYSVAAQAAVRRTQEIGLRMAVGASRSQILVMIARQGLALAAAGIAVGMAASYALSKYLESWLYEVTPTDPLTFGAAALLLALVAWIATVIPAQRAARLDPMKALRYE